MNATAQAAITAAANPDPAAWAASIADTAKGVEEGHAKGLDEGRAAVGVKPGDLNAFESGAAAARRVLGKVVAASAEMLKFNAGAEAARGLLGKVVGGEAELAAFNSGAAAARALLGKKPEPTSANF
jgi:hypothetical protein